MRYNKIYILAPYQKTTGGIELAHQLIDYLVKKGQHAFVVYTENDRIVSTSEVTEAYRLYKIQVTDVIEDDSRNMLILPETYFDFILKYKNINIGCWWMSVNNRYIKTTFKEALLFQSGLGGKWNELKRFLLNRGSFRLNDNNLLHKEQSRIIHFYQSAYAQYHLYANHFNRVLPLSDYINNDFVGNEGGLREDVILYNPKKGIKYTQEIIKRMPDYHFVALSGFDRAGLTNRMRTAKLYIDFGEFPGKDRLPREAILNGCCILTGKIGAASYYEDVPIPAEYKMETKRNNLP